LLQKKWRSSTIRISNSQAPPPSATNNFHFPVTLTPGSIAIGFFEMAFECKSQFLYRAASPMQGMFIRKKNWIQLVTSSPKIAEAFDNMKSSAIINAYLRRVYLPVQEAQTSQLKQEAQN